MAEVELHRGVQCRTSPPKFRRRKKQHVKVLELNIDKRYLSVEAFFKMKMCFLDFRT